MCVRVQLCTLEDHVVSDGISVIGAGHPGEEDIPGLVLVRPPRVVITDP
jgi:hypothetical protein